MDYFGYNPPTYTEAVDRDPWKCIAPYAHFTDLYSVCRVSKHLNRIFTTLLWRNPCFEYPLGGGSAAEVAVFTRFLQAIKIARQTTRYTTRMIDVSCLSALFVDQLDPHWMDDVLLALPNVTVLNSSQNAFADRQSLQMLSPRIRQSNLPAPVGLNIRLLNLSHCKNTIPSSLCHLFTHVPRLYYLDLSYTAGASHPTVLEAVGRLVYLQILKLRRTALRDEDLASLTAMVGTRLWSLDVRDNKLTDEAATDLLCDCFLPPVYDPEGRSLVQYHGSDPFSDERVYKPIPVNIILRPDRTRNRMGEDEEKHVREMLLELPAFHDVPPADSGLTHLYVSGNAITPEGLSQLLKSTKLQALDYGIILCETSEEEGPEQRRRELAELFEEIEYHTAGRLRWLRISHDFVTAPRPDRRPSRIIQEGFPKTWLTSIPLSVPWIETLVLTNVPQHTIEDRVPKALETFLMDCAKMEADVAKAQYESGVEAYARARDSGLGSSSMEPPAVARCLKTLVLEMAPKLGRAAASPMLSLPSITDDTDSDVSMSTSLDDFSFFPGEISGNSINEQMTGVGSITSSRPLKLASRTPVPTIDVIKHLKDARQRWQQAHMDAARLGQDSPGSQHYWSGTISITYPSQD